ncbi:hypothetical protein SO802_033923 [Lithocarpus litseifolius]|uniref:CCHC-type domain-containing protein n=1 Tax=Lithocarpus litseifolius TaxID=425828 RepID=A0AAW2BFS7_9ROSI
MVLVSPVSMTNRFVVSTIPKPNYERPIQPNYSSALVTPAPRTVTPYTINDPFGPIQSQRSSQVLSRRNRSSYVKKSFIQHISYIEPHIVHIKDPLALAMKVLPEGWHYIPKHPEKNIKYYRDWGRHPSLLKTLTGLKSLSGSELHYSYYDYMDTFEKVLLYQNKNFDHSWFIMFDKKFFGQIPTWFLKWWEMFGLVPQIWPELLQNTLRYFSSRFQITSHNSQFPAILLITVKYRIHWISMWNYAIQNQLLNRLFNRKPLTILLQSQSFVRHEGAFCKGEATSLQESVLVEVTYSNEGSKKEIKQAIQKDEEGLPIFDEHLGRGIPNGVNTFIYTIIKHFVAKPSNITSRIYDQLSNLGCRTLGDYRWYEDVFTTRVMHRSDCNSPFWKEKFINGLPRLFGERVKETLCNPLGVIDYDNLTYGDISSTIHSEGIKMCRDFKIQSQASKSKVKYEVGNFCTQYGLPPIALSKRKSKFRGQESPKKSHRRITASRFYRKQKYSKEDDFYKKGKPSRSKFTGKYEKPTKASGKCFNYGKKGHFSIECRSKAKSLINTLVSDQTSKDEIFRLLNLDHIESDSTNSSNDHEIHQLNQSSSSKPSRDSESSSSPGIDFACRDSCCRNKTINVLNKQVSVLSKQEELLLDLIEQIEDLAIKAQKLSAFNATLVKETSKPEPRNREPKVDLEKIYDRFSKFKKEVTVNDL